MRPRRHENRVFAGEVRAEIMNSFLVDLGTMAYQEAHQFQLDCVNYRLVNEDRPDIFIVTEHPPVFTLGKRGGLDSLTVAREHVTGKGVSIVQTERGGDITYHGPGQLVVYPIVHLRKACLSIKEYVDLLEEAMLATTADFCVKADRDQRNRGIWIGDNKIGSIGIRVRHGVTFHGLALNVSLDFEHFSWIQPCGLSGVGVTSIASESREPVDFSAVKLNIIQQLGQVFNRQFTTTEKTLVTGCAA